MRPPHRTGPAGLAALAAGLGLLLGGCSYGNGTCGCRADESCIGGRCLPIEPLPPGSFQDPRATPVDCGPFTLVAGGPNPGAPASDPGCQLAPRGSALPAAGTGFGWTDLGEHAVGEAVAFTVPAGTMGITLVEQAVSALPTVTVLDAQPVTVDNVAVPVFLTDPSGAIVYDDRLPAVPDGSAQALFFASGAANTGALAYPDTSAGLTSVEAAFAASGDGVAPGTWTVTVGDWAYECWLATANAVSKLPPVAVLPTCDPASAVDTGRYRLALLTTPVAPRGPGVTSAVPPRATLDVVFHLLDATSGAGGVVPIDLTAASAVEHPRVKRMVASYAHLLRGAGLCLGTATFHDEPTWARNRFATGALDPTPGPCANLPQILSLSVAGARTLELFLVPRVGVPDPTSHLTVVGIDGTIPGPGTFNGTVTAGALVSAENLLHEAVAGACPTGSGPLALSSCGADQVAYIAAHESGHFLGLYHPTESDGAHFDPLSDTPHCACVPACGHVAGSCGAGMLASDCVQGRPQCSGGGNLMFWLIQPSVSQGFLSPEQGQVVRSGPLPRIP